MIQHNALLLPPPAPVSTLSLFLSLSVCRRSSLLKGGRREWAEPNYTTAMKAWPSVNHSILSVYLSDSPREVEEGSMICRLAIFGLESAMSNDDICI
jgi:hypothetical protein